MLSAAYKSPENAGTSGTSLGKVRRSENSRIKDAVQALALCHNVTPVYEKIEGSETSE